MSTTAGAPLLTYSRGADIATELANILTPEYDMVHSCIDLEAALTEIPAVLSGDCVMPSTRLGSNVDRPEKDRRVPKVVIFGGGIPMEEVEKVKDAAGEKNVTWIKIDADEVRASGWPPSAEILAPIVRRKLREAGF